MPAAPQKIVESLLDPDPKTGGYQPLPLGQSFIRIRDLLPFSYDIIRAMDMEPTIRLGERARMAALMGMELAYKDGEEWKTGVEAEDPRIAAFVERQYKRIWSHGVDHLLTAQKFGWAGCEVMHYLSRERAVEVDYLLPRASLDTFAIEQRSDICGVQFRNIKEADSGTVSLRFPKCILHSHDPDPGVPYGKSIRAGAYSPWADKWLNGGALDVRRLFMHKDAYGGVDMSYPEGSMNINGQVVPNRDVARQIAEQIKAGGVTTRPSQLDDKGNERWKITRATVPSNPSHILEFPGQCDVEMLRGMEVPDEVLIEGEGSSGYAGKRVPMGAFYAGLDCWLSHLLQDLDYQQISHLVELRFGKGRWYQVTHKPLAIQAAENQGGMGKGEGGPPQQFGQSRQSQFPSYDGDGDGMRGDAMRMGLDPYVAIGRGVVKAAEIVKASRKVLRMEADGEGKWITIGAKTSGDGERRGGVPVQIVRGKIVKGPAKFVGRKIGEFAEKSQPDSRLYSAVHRAASENNVSKRALKDAVDFVHSEKKEAAERRERAKAQLRKHMGMNQADMDRIEESGHDFTKIKGFDALARTAASEIPDLDIGSGFEDGANYDDTDYAAQVWELLKEGKQDLPARHHDDIINEAVQLVKASKKQRSAYDSAVPFSLVRMGEFKESDHPRDDDGRFGSGGDTAVVNVPLAKRGNIDSQLDRYKKDQAAGDRKKRSDDYKQKLGDKAVARKLFDQHAEAWAERMEKTKGLKKSDVLNHLDSLVKHDPEKARKMFEGFAKERAGK